MSHRTSHRLAIALATCALMACTQQAAAQSKEPARKDEVLAEPTTTSATYGDWVLRCVLLQAEPNATGAGKTGRALDKSCEIIQAVQVQGQQQPIAQFAIGRLPKADNLTMTAVVPVNVSLPGMVHVSGNGKTGAAEKGRVDLAWKACFPGGCVANAPLDKTSLAALLAEAQGQLRFNDAAGSTVAIPVSWKGIKQAVNALEKSAASPK